MLVIKIEIEKNTENLQAALKALEAFDIASAAWEDEVKVEQKIDAKLRTGEAGDLGAAVSAAADRMVRRHRGSA